ncbi:isovaleryl-coA dehydrogenase [Leishmania donovani]|uniref:Isobutyryl-CoA dehydrogenase, mitochondrial n=3 Tax=Leishmania donovani species complex TaxID=38574 RepID=A0A6L0XHA0_LEIIN|nr:putative isovaleryl-coA dehydrogenase [Leishmania infantum JPCM5]XP_003861935.1 isovaleryl-coA dehydrogenase, putative [Leishmania donovani]CAC9499321.1 isovaleryl-coA_dehydrogenase_-_putative [Leishmania infantum]AYU79975.1 isovaleryl-coA dehydrogenase, putative [Leishmania donovani]TPP46099.1 Acyl-CoA dehydrogenase, C-terminal domain family protein [Leishmania donovani]TPP47559.1 Acyl-CoA dehydrogenase, C-terminal domain family protein [Leishmania donovani]CAJ1989959.1 isovaleryl-coA deh|eukprot:XP_001466486.1 putative isovaleryl-coA dehydrogenase [Leishmania infantum JPCM5]
MRRVLQSSLGRRSATCGWTAAATMTSASRAFMDLYNPTPEHAALRETVAKFSREVVDKHAREDDINGHFNRDLFKQLGDLGVMGVTVPEADGGAGMDAVAAVIIHHELSKYDPGFCLAYLAHSMLFVNNFYYSASPAQRARWLPKVLTGEHVGAMGMSEPSAGTDVLGMRMTAKKDSNGNYVLNGSKIWITNGTVADVFLIYAKVDGKITAFTVERGTKGFTQGPKIDKCGMRASHMCQLFLEDVVVPAENLLGEEGKGMVGMMRNLELERVTLAAMAVGIAERSVELMTSYASERKAFGQPISNFGQIQRYIAEGYADTEAAKALVYSVSHNVHPGNKNRLGSDAAKLFATPIAKKVADSAIQVMGGMGYSQGMPVERLWRDAKLLEIGGGTIEAHHKNITKDLLKGLK